MSEDPNSTCQDLDKAQLKQLGEKLNKEKKNNPFIYWGDIPETPKKELQENLRVPVINK